MPHLTDWGRFPMMDSAGLHDLMKKAASHEEAWSLGGAIHEAFECNLLGFLRTEAGKGAWQQVTGRSVTARQAQEIWRCNIR